MTLKYVLLAFSTLLFGFIGSIASADTVDYVEKKADFFYSSMYSFYSCDYAEDRVEAMVEALGGVDADARCSGGLPYMQHVSVRVKFKAAVPGTTQPGGYTPVKFVSRDACDFHERMFRQISESFNIIDGDVSASCWDSRGTFRFEGSVLK